MQENDQEFSFRSLFLPFTTGKAIHFIIFIGFLVFGNALFNGFVGDDNLLIVQNPQIHLLSNVFKVFSNSIFVTTSNGNTGLTYINSGIFYRPLQSLIFLLIYTISGPQPFVYHIFLLGLEIVNTTIVFFIFRKFLKIEIAFITALVFLLHPINNEVAVYISSLQESLFLFFGLLAIFLVQQKKASRFINCIVGFLLLFSLLSKETGLLFLFVIPLYQIIFFRKWKIELLRSGFVFAIYIILRVFIAKIFINQDATSMSVPFLNSSLGEKLGNMPAIILFYLKTFFYPKDLMMMQTWVIKSFDFSNFYLPLLLDILFFLLILFFGIIVYRYQKSQIRLFVFFLIWFIIGLVLNLQLIPLDGTVTLRWFYFPIVGLLGMIGLVLNMLNLKNKQIRWIYTIVVGIILIIFSTRDIVRNTNWNNNLTLYRHEIMYDSNNSLLHADLGIALLNNGDKKEAIHHLRQSIKLYPTYQNWTILGRVYARINKIPEAKEALHTALTYNKKYYPAYVTLAEIMLTYDKPKPTVDFLKKFLSYYPMDAVAWLYLAIEENQLGSKQEALSAIQKSYSIYPSQKAIDVHNSIITNTQIKINFSF